MSGNPDIPFDKETELFNEKVRELMAALKEKHPGLSENALRYLAEEMTEPSFFFSQEKQERPN